MDFEDKLADQTVNRLARPTYHRTQQQKDYMCKLAAKIILHNYKVTN